MRQGKKNFSPNYKILREKTYFSYYYASYAELLQEIIPAGVYHAQHEKQSKP